MRLFNIALAAAVAGFFAVVLYYGPSDAAQPRPAVTRVTFRSAAFQPPGLPAGGACRVTCIAVTTPVAAMGDAPASPVVRAR